VHSDSSWHVCSGFNFVSFQIPFLFLSHFKKLTLACHLSADLSD
jgi:hypothetical protein